MKLTDDTPEPDDWLDRYPKNPPRLLLSDEASLNPDNLFSFEGVDGSGKSTVLRKVVSISEERGKTVRRMELGGSDVIYHAMQRAKWVNADPISINLLNWVSLYDQTIRIREQYNTPQLIFFDRYTMTVKVRGLVEGQDLVYMNILEKGVPKPRKIFLFDCDPEICLARLKAAGRGITYIETGARDVDFDPGEFADLDDSTTRERAYVAHVERLREEYRKLAQDVADLHFIDNSGPLDHAVEEVLSHLE